MKILLFLCATVAMASAWKGLPSWEGLESWLEKILGRPGTCPIPSSDFGACVITPESCIFDLMCGEGQKCCSEGCGKKCRDTVETTRRNQERGGTCPSDGILAECLYTTGTCSYDSQCGDGQKCCQEGCNRKCMDTVETTHGRPGICPDDGIMVDCLYTTENCSNDWNCNEGQKCCRDGCDRKCIDVVLHEIPPVERPGRCPSLRPSNRVGACVFTPENCLNDSECGDGQKCCSDGCGKKCMTVVKEKPGTCPYEGLLTGCRFTNDICPDDSECLEGQKCCQEGCTRKCMDTVETTRRNKEGRGTCPDDGLRARCLYINDICPDDSECNDGQKCCTEGCTRKCMDTVETTRKNKERRGTCPDDGLRARCLYINDICKNDWDCNEGGQKCCQEGCDRKCMDTVETTHGRPGICPDDGIMVDCLYTTENCSNDWNCNDGQKCCRDGCDKKCIDVKIPPVKRPGRCPKPKPSNEIGACVFTPENCLKDSDCGDGQKCCSDGCGKKCKTVVKERRGTCPSDGIFVDCLYTTESCSYDFDCKKGQKCCIEGCDRKCMDTVETTRRNQNSRRP